jgi:hypothetical protein
MNDRVDIANPFSVYTPEDIPAKDAVSLFVDVFTDFQHIKNVGHVFLNGARGSGKSMMFRYLEPDCQQLALQLKINQLPFFGVYIPIKNTEVKLTELKRLDNVHADVVLNEHFLVLYVAIKFLSSITKANIDDASGENGKLFGEYLRSEFARQLARAGHLGASPGFTSVSFQELLTEALAFFIETHGEVLNYLRRLSFSTTPLPFTGPLFGYLDFLLPFLKRVKSLPFMPQGPIFLLLDDADNLSATQAKILNSWVFCRTSQHVSLKISTQMRYPTFLTVTGQSIDSPHDFFEVNISSVYTSHRGKYLDRVKQIVERRLKMSGLDGDPYAFFPVYEKQEDEIDAIKEKIRLGWEEQGRGNRPSDDATRYARPNYMRSLEGSSKSGHTYKYAGFEQLVHISSGVIRYFLEAAAVMYGEMRSRTISSVIEIDPAVQDEVIRKQAEDFLYSEFDRWSADEDEKAIDPSNITAKLRNLIRALGGAFHEILISDRSERRVFSVALSDEPSEEVRSVFQLGIQYGYFHQSSIGNKEGTGRTRLYILSRRLAPVFKLDPTSFAGYKFVTNIALLEAMNRPQSFINKVRQQGDELLEDAQLTLDL